ncbi:hypothetical protein ABZ372_50055, partial [Streptomyces sp. NPDC005921]
RVHGPGAWEVVPHEQAMLGDAQMRLLTGAPYKLTEAEVRASVVEAVRVFLRGVSVPGADGLG